METKFADFSAAIIGLETSDYSRQVLNESLLEIGFKKISIVKSHQEIFDSLSTIEIDWIIAPITSSGDINLLHILRTISETATLSSIRVSALYLDSEVHCMTTAFELGLLSCHVRSNQKERILSHFKNLLKRYEINLWNSTLTAADYLRQVLIDQSQFEANANLDRDLLMIYPSFPRLLIHLGEAFFLQGKMEEGKNCLAQADLLDHRLKKMISSVEDTYLLGEKKKEKSGRSPIINTLGLKKCVVVDADQASINAIREILLGIGVDNVISFEDGLSAFNWIIENSDVDIIFHEWRLPQLTGPFLIQRIRNANLHHIPIITVSGLVKTQDRPLLSEMGVSYTVSKPLKKQSFLQAIIRVIQEERHPSTGKSKARKMRQLLTKNENSEANNILISFTEDPSIPHRHKLMMKAEFAYNSGKFELARDLSQKALTMSDDSILCLNILSKSLLSLGDYKTALHCFEIAKKLSPLNIERLCKIAESHLHIGNVSEAEVSIQEAINLDHKNPIIPPTQAKIELEKGNTLSAKKLISNLESLDEVIAYINNKAVALARSGKPKEGISLYNKALESIPDDHNETKAAVHYNMALAYIRCVDYSQALSELETAKGLTKSKIFRKASSLKSRLSESIQSGSHFTLNSCLVARNKNSKEGFLQEEVEEFESELNETRSKLLESLQIKKGDLCLFNIFHNKENVDLKTINLLNGQPRFFIKK